MITKILSFDISSTTTAYAVLSFNDKTKEIQFISADYIKPIKDGTIIERLANTRDQIQKIINDTNPDHISIEDIIMFVPNRSTAQTIITLASFNRMISLLSFDYLQKMPGTYGVLQIRRALAPGKDLPAKEDMPELVAWHLNINFPYEYNKKGKIKIENGDIADAIAVGLMHALELGGKTNPTGPIPNITIKEKIKKKKIKSKKKVKLVKKNGRKKRI
jgi:Holliday junction resolvasome RuvABC endonuclease subunit